MPEPESEDASNISLTNVSELNITSHDRVDGVKTKPYVWPEAGFKAQVDKVNDFKSLIKNTLVMMKEEPIKKAARRYYNTASGRE